MATASDQELEELFNAKLREHFVFEDDSSEDSYDGAKAKAELERFNHENNCMNDFGHNNLSFITCAVAIKFLYSPQIQKKYDEMKKDHKIYFKPNFDFETLKLAIRNSAKHVAQWDWPRYRTVDSIESVISTKIYGNAEMFSEALIHGKLSEFFSDLTDPDGAFGYNPSDLLSGNSCELGTLRVYSVRPNFSPDLSRGENFSIDFFSTLRMHNELAKMDIKYNKNNMDRWEMRLSEWRYSDRITVRTEHGLIRMGSTFRRSEMVYFFGNSLPDYGSICAGLQLTDQHAVELGDIFPNGASQISDENVASLHLLLFGIEVMRNPSSLIINMMMLDLIRKGRLSWEQALKENEMPMSMQYAERASRIKSSHYYEFMPHKYLYDQKYDQYAKDYPNDRDRNYELAKRLYEREKNITSKWLEMQLDEEMCGKMMEGGDIKMEFVENIFNILQEACHEWFLFDFNNNSPVLSI